MSGNEGTEVALVSDWVESCIDTVAATLDALVIEGVAMTGLSGRVFEDLAPEGTPYPFIVFQCQTPPRDVRGVGTTTVMVDTMYLVKVIAQVPRYNFLAPIVKVLHDALTTATGSSTPAGDIFTSVRTEGFRLLEVDNGKQYRHLGAMYQIHAKA